jgi:GNAT superfamily N-acetyltransferase
MFRLLNESDYINYYPLINEFRATIFTEEEFKAFLKDKPNNIEIWILEKDNKIVATTTVIYEKKLIFNMCTFAHIEDVCILKAYQSQGIGSKIIKFILEQARNKKCFKVTLVCNEKTSEFYIKNGFEIRGVQCSYLIT